MIQAGCCYHGPVPYTQVIQFLHFKIFCLLLKINLLIAYFVLFTLEFISFHGISLSSPFPVPNVFLSEFPHSSYCNPLPVLLLLFDCPSVFSWLSWHLFIFKFSSYFSLHLSLFLMFLLLVTRILDSFTSYRQKQGFVNQKQECQTHFTSHATYSTLCS